MYILYKTAEHAYEHMSCVTGLRSWHYSRL